MIDFNEMIDNFLSREFKPKDIGRYYPSEIGMCMRKVWYSYKYPAPLEKRLLKIFAMGNIMHDFVVDVLKSEKNPHIDLVKSEFPFREKIDDFTISGRIDNLIQIKSNSTNLLIEVKSTGDIRGVKDPQAHNIDQLQLYMHFINVKDGSLLYIDKKNMKSKVFHIPYNKEHAEKIIERFKKLHLCLTKDVVPDPEARMSVHKTWMCNFCEHRDRCYMTTPGNILE